MTFPGQFMFLLMMFWKVNLLLVSRRSMVRLGVSKVGVGELVQGQSRGEEKEVEEQGRCEDPHLPSLCVLTRAGGRAQVKKPTLT